MAKSFACFVLLCLLASQVECSRDKRAITFPTINIFDPVGSFNSVINFVKSIVGEINNVGAQALKVAGDMKTNLENVVKQTINATETEVQKLVKGVETTIKDRLANGPVANAIKAAACAKQGIDNATAAGQNVVKSSVACITDEANAFLRPIPDLIDKGSRALSLGKNVYNNLTSCFPNGFSVGGFDLLNALGCSVGKIGPAMTEVTTIVTSITSDIQSIQSAFANTRNAIIVCPRKRLAELVINLGNDVTDFGKCMDSIIADS